MPCGISMMRGIAPTPSGSWVVDVELATLLRRAQLLRPSPTGRRPPKGASPRFAGPPGMGKTALAEEFVRLQQQAAAKPGASAAAVLATLDVLDGPPAQAACRLASRLPLPAAMLRRLLPDADARILRGAAKGGGLASFSAAAAHLMRGGDPAAVLMRQMGLSEHSDAITSLMALRPMFWPNGLVICVDEAQNLQPNSAPAGFLDAVHQNVRQAPLCFAAFGLPGLKKAFDDAGISRFTPNMPYVLGLLTEDEPSQLVHLNLDALGLAARPDNGTPLADLARRNGFRTEQWAEWREEAVRRILDASGDFPHHLQNGVAAMAKLVADAGLDFHPRKVGHDALGREHEAMQKDYYEARMGAIGPHSLALGAAFAACGAGCPSSEDIVRAVQASTDKGVRMDGGTAENVVDRAVAKGVLQTVAPDRDAMDVPIPSFRDYLTQRFHAALAAGRGAAALLADNLGIDADNSSAPCHLVFRQTANAADAISAQPPDKRDGTATPEQRASK